MLGTVSRGSPQPLPTGGGCWWHSGCCSPGPGRPPPRCVCPPAASPKCQPQQSGGNPKPSFCSDSQQFPELNHGSFQALLALPFRAGAVPWAKHPLGAPSPPRSPSHLRGSRCAPSPPAVPPPQPRPRSSPCRPRTGSARLGGGVRQRGLLAPCGFFLGSVRPSTALPDSPEPAGPGPVGNGRGAAGARPSPPGFGVLTPIASPRASAHAARLFPGAVWVGGFMAHSSLLPPPVPAPWVPHCSARKAAPQLSKKSLLQGKTSPRAQGPVRAELAPPRV